MHESLMGETKQRCCHKCKRFHCGSCFMLIALIFFILSIVLPGVIEEALLDGIYDQATLTQSAMDRQTTGWKTWADTREASSIQYLSVWFYNVTNHPDVLHGATPKLKEVGPYVYRQINWVQNISFPVSSDGFKLIKFKDWIWYQFEPSQSFAGANPLNDSITILNLGMLGLFYQYQDVAYMLYNQQSEIDRMYATHAPQDWLFGYKDETLAKIKQVFPGILTNQSLDDALARKYDYVYTGEDDHSLTRQYYMAQESPIINCIPDRLTNALKPCWGGPEANRLHGTDGAQFAPANIVQEGGSVTTWVDDLFREIALYNTDSETLEIQGITLHKFMVRKDQLQNKQNNPDNAQYYADGLDGYWNITFAQGLLPTFVSMPHLLYGDPMMFNFFEGMRPPVKENDEVTIGIELNTGIAMSARKRWQINFGVQPLHFHQGATWFANVSMPLANESKWLYHPTVWMELRGDVSSDDASTFKSGVYLAKSMFTFFKWGAMSIAIVSLLVTLGIWFPLLTAHAHKERVLDPMA